MINKEEEAFSDLCNNKQIREAGTTVDDDPCTQISSLYENIDSDSEDALSVYDVYTVWNVVLFFVVAFCDNSYSFYRIILFLFIIYKYIKCRGNISSLKIKNICL